MLLPEYVDSEKEKLLDSIKSRLNDKRSWALQRLIEQMCCYEPFAVSRLGTEDTAENIYYQKLTKHYRSLIMTCPIEIFYCGSLGAGRRCRKLSDAFSGMPRGEIDYDIGTDIRMNAVEESVREFTRRAERHSGASSSWLSPRRLHGRIRILRRFTFFNAVFGGCVTSSFL